MKKAVILSSLLFSIGASIQAADQTYDWVSSDGVTDISATITLDSSSSAGGSFSDIISGSLTDPNGTINFLTLNNLIFESPFTWNPSEITGMLISGHATADEDLLVENNLIGDTTPSVVYGDVGSWVAVQSVGAPDGGSSLWMLGLAVAGLGGLKRSKFFTL